MVLVTFSPCFSAPSAPSDSERFDGAYGRIIGYPMLKPHDLRHGVAMEVYEQHHDLEEVRGLLGHTRIETTQLYAQIRPAGLKQAVAFYETKALDALGQ